VVTGGWNTAYTAEAYAMIGGYDPHATKGEDLSIENRISMLRSSDGEIPNPHVVGKIPTRSDSSPRRLIYEAISGLPAYSDSFEDESVNKRIREKSPEELLDMIKYLSRINDSNKNYFEEMIRSSYGFIKGTTPSTEEAEKSMRFVMLMAGFEKSDYEFTSDGNINIKNWNNVSKALKDYRARHSRPRNPGERTKYKTT
jgi:hypothetical protein